MDEKEKAIAKQLLGQCIQQIIGENREGKRPGSIRSIRQLASSSGVEYSILQKITSGKKNPQFTTLLAIAQAFDLSVSELLAGYGKPAARPKRKKAP